MQLRALGLSNDAIRHRLRTGRLFRVHHCVYSVGRPPSTPIERASAAVLACGLGAGLAHRAALALWGLAKPWPSPPFDVIVSRDRRPKGIKVHVARNLHPAKDFRTHLGIRVTSPARTFLDCAPGLDDTTRTRAINDARRAGLLHLDTLADTLARFPLHPAVKLLRPFVDDATGGPTDSGFEDELVRFCRRYGLPIPETNRYIAGHRVDAVFRAQRVIVECDGWVFHSDRAAFENDRNRDADTLEAGYVTIRLTKRRLRDQPDREAERLHNILASRASPPPARSPRRPRP